MSPKYTQSHMRENEAMIQTGDRIKCQGNKRNRK